MLGRLLVGMVKGLLLGALCGWALAAAGLAVPGALVAYPAAGLVGALCALVAGKPVWAADARIEVGAKAIAGLLLGPGLLWLARRFLTMGLPADVIAQLPGLDAAALATTAPALGTFAPTALAMVTAIVAGFFDADHDPKAEPTRATVTRAPATGKRVTVDAEAAVETDEEAESEAVRRRKA